MNEIFGRYIGSVFCSFQRVAFREPAWYIISSENAIGIHCTAILEADKGWILDQPQHEFFINNNTEILRVINHHEMSINSPVAILRAV